MRSKFTDDMSQLFNNAMGLAQGAKTEADSVIKSWVERWLGEHDLVTREEFDAALVMAQKAREENASLAARIDALEAEIKQSKPVKKATKKAPAKKTAKA